MSKGKHGNKEAKKPKRAQPLAAPLLSAEVVPAVAPAQAFKPKRR